MNLGQFTSKGKFLMLALDHRESLVKLMINQDEIIDFKAEIIEALEPQFSALLIDKLGLEAYKTKTKPYIMPLEKSGSEVAELEYTVEELIDFGAKGAKLLVKFNLDNKATQLPIAREALEDCRAHNLPFFLEIVTHSDVILGSDATPESDSGQVPPQRDPAIGGARMTENVLVNSVKIFIDNGIIPDVWKLEYPGSFEQCQEITRLVGDTPWILLTGGDKFEVFCEHLRVTTRAGAKGFLAGRALWQELVGLQGEAREEFLTKTLPERFRVISKIVLGGEYSYG